MRDLRLEGEIIARWGEAFDNPIISVCCITYNQESYIEDALEGFLIQKTDFAFEILVHDDASTDRTAEIVREYAALYPRLIKPIYQAENQYSKGLAMNETFNYPRAKGKYIAFCEGDDYWFSEDKLQVQVDLLESNPGVSLTFHPAKTISEEVRQGECYGFYGNKERIQSCRDIILKGGGYMPMASIMVRKEVLDKLRDIAPEFLGRNMSHFFYQVFGSLKGGGLYHPSIMSAYRSMHEGSWSLKVQSEPVFFIKAAEKYIDSIQAANMITGFVYNKEFSRRIKRRILVTINNVSIPVEVRKNFFNKHSDSLGIGGYFLWNFVFCCKPLHLLILKIKNKCSI